MPSAEGNPTGPVSWDGLEYVALGSSFAAGPGVGDPDPNAPPASGRSRTNYAQLTAGALGLKLRDVTFSGATTATILRDRQDGEPPQVEAVRASTRLVTITIGGNDVGYVTAIGAAGVSRLLRRMPVIGRPLRSALDRDERDHLLSLIESRLRDVALAVRHRAPDALIIFVDYLTLLPPEGMAAPPLSAEDAALGRHIAGSLEQATAAAARDTGARVISAAASSRQHHAWSTEPWTTGPAGRGPLARLGSHRNTDPLHPNQAGMTSISRLLVAHLQLHPPGQ